MMLRVGLCVGFLLLISVQGIRGDAPVGPVLRQPHLIVVDQDGVTTVMGRDIVSLLKENKCSHDLMLDYLYSDEGQELFPEELTNPSSNAYVQVYDGNIVLLSLVYHAEHFDAMCEADVIKDLTSLSFCEDLKVEKAFEESFILEFNDTLTKYGFVELVRLAGRLHALRGEEDCKDICGGKFKTVLCKAFTEIAAFFTVQVIKEELSELEGFMDTRLNHF